ncbi:phosphotransferase family protein [Ruania halotolerans]|uniref:phosphotransferase family protein n=1 Tax=Ruania halotolerans TaxID=2897773 RepID=UPI001E4973AF|nr:phosphotransferase [Ruania halotolerans]UFU08065.1 phosphotransferase [Ruania halotolerans]
MSFSPGSARDLLTARGYAPAQVRPLQGGAWSTAFAARCDGRDLVLRLGGPSEDYAADAYAATLGHARLPIPAVLEHGRLDAGELTGTTYAISEFVPGTPLEHASPTAWAALAPQLADILEGLRATRPDATDQSAPSWREHLLQVGDYPWQAGWRERADHAGPEALALFDRGLDALRGITPVTVPVSLLHADWINRNVHVADDRITGIFDWGCSRFGDHLYDLAWFEFWAPWHPNLDVPLLVRELEARWDAVGISPVDHPGRHLACLLHIGLDHIVYNILHGTEEALAGTMDRLTEFL